MDTPTLGPQGPKVSAMGLGLAALGRPGYINLGHGEDLDHAYGVEEMEARTHAVLDAAYAAGIRYFDAARSYGRAEEFLSHWLQTHPEAAREVTVGSKWGYAYTANWQVQAEKHEVKEHSREQLERQWPESQALLGSALKVYQIHSATLESGVLDKGPVLDALARLRDEEGLVIGLSVSGPQQATIIDKALGIERNGKRLFGSVQATFNILEPSTAAVLRAAHQLGVGVIVKEALANGRLTGRNNDPAFAKTAALLRVQARALETTVDALALAWVLVQEFVDVVLSGAAQTEHLHANLAAAHLRLPSPVREAMGPLQETPEAYWAYRKQLPWN